AIAAEAAETERWIAGLADADAAVRAEASRQLVRQGADSRPAVMRAVRSPSPAVAEGAAEVLLKLPWSKPTDSRRARQALAGYGTLAPLQRVDVLHALATSEDAAGARTAIRVAAEDPAPIVAWTFASMMSGDDAFVAELARSGVDAATPAYRYAVTLGQVRKAAKFPFEEAHRQQMFAALADMAAVSIDTGPLPDGIRRALLTDARYRGDHARVLSLRRVLTTAEDDSQQTPNSSLTPGEAILAYHAAHGPLPGLATDAADADPLVVAATLARIADRADVPLLANVCWQTLDGQLAQMPPDDRADAYLRLGEWLEAAGDYRAAAGTLNKIDSLNLPASDDRLRSSYFRRLELAVACDDDRLAITALEQMQQSGQMLNVGTFEDQLYWRRWRLERHKPEVAGDEKVIERIKEIAAGDSTASTSIDIIPWLDAHGRGKDAQAIFDGLFNELQQQVASEKVNDLNNLAWLCSRSRRRLDEARVMQTKVLAQAPANAAYVDTMSDIEAARGDYAAALHWETIASRLQPGMPFFQDQMFLFRAALSAQK
ncbi:MAG TPA: hypothetical protein VF624_17610, partial [Tepidisphaeraceae bacterium]